MTTPPKKNRFSKQNGLEAAAAAAATFALETVPSVQLRPASWLQEIRGRDREEEGRDRGREKEAGRILDHSITTMQHSQAAQPVQEILQMAAAPSSSLRCPPARQSGPGGSSQTSGRLQGLGSPGAPQQPAPWAAHPFATGLQPPPQLLITSPLLDHPLPPPSSSQADL